MKTLNMILCQGRHECPDSMIKDGAIFEYSLSPEQITNPSELSAIAMGRLADKMITNSDDDYHLNLVVSGLTVALMAVVNACIKFEVELSLFHFDRSTGEYYEQVVLTTLQIFLGAFQIKKALVYYRFERSKL